MGLCPKCSRERPTGADACPRCGLLVSRWAVWAPPALDQPVLEGLWAKVEAEWESDAAHARFLDQAAVLGALDLAAACYRRKLGPETPEKRERAQAGLDRAVRLALQLHEGKAEDPGLASAARYIKFTGIFIALVLFVATGWVIWKTLSRPL